MKQKIEYIDICPRSYDLKHLWREGTVYKPLAFWGFTFSFIYWGKPVMNPMVCQACGMMKSEEVKYDGQN